MPRRRGGMISITSRGSFRRTDTFLERVTGIGNVVEDTLNRSGFDGVDALAAATPTNTGLTSQSWDFETESLNGQTVIRWINTNIVEGANVALLLVFGHGTRQGGYVAPNDFVTDTIEPVYDSITDSIWQEVGRS